MGEVKEVGVGARGDDRFESGERVEIGDPFGVRSRVLSREAAEESEESWLGLGKGGLDRVASGAGAGDLAGLSRIAFGRNVLRLCAWPCRSLCTLNSAILAPCPLLRQLDRPAPSSCSPTCC